MRLSKWSLGFAPVVTFFLGLLIGGLPDDQSAGSRAGAIGLYLVIVLAIWIPLEVLARRHERNQQTQSNHTR